MCATVKEHFFFFFGAIRHLVHVEVLYDGIETRVEIVEQVDHLQRSAFRAQRREAHDVTEVNCHAVVSLGHHGLSQNQLAGHGPTKRIGVNGLVQQ